MAAPRGLAALLLCVAICGAALLVEGRKTAFDSAMTQADLNAIEILERVRCSFIQGADRMMLFALPCRPVRIRCTLLSCANGSFAKKTFSTEGRLLDVYYPTSPSGHALTLKPSVMADPDKVSIEPIIVSSC